MAVYNDSYDNEEERRADLAWEYRKGGPNDPNLYAEEEPEEDAEEEEEVRLIDANRLQKEYIEEHGKRLLLIDIAPTVDRVINVYPKGEVIVQEKRPQDAVQYSIGYQDGYLEAKKIYERPHGEWIAVKDKYPDKEGEYLVSLDNGRIVVADDRSIIENHDYAPKMLAWKPLPEPYCGAGGDPA